MLSYISDTKKVPNENKSGSPLSHQVGLEQSEAKQKPQSVAQKWTTPLSRFIPKRKPVCVYLVCYNCLKHQALLHKYVA